MAKMDCCVPSHDPSGRVTDLPCLSDPVKRSMLGLRLGLLMLHILFIGFLFIFVEEFRSNSKKQPWCTLIYMLLVVATLVQYYFTSGSSPGYVLDAMRDFDNAEALLSSSEISDCDSGLLGNNPMNWTNLVMELYPHGTSVREYTCSYCNVVQPPRSKHCHDCDKCVLQFDHHCVWMGTCIGLGNHCRFWWYLLEETAVCIWTGFLYIENLQGYSERALLVNVIMIIMICILLIGLMFLLLLLLFHSYLVVTNQTTYELLRRRRIPYMRMIPERVYPFNKGACRNMYNFFFARTSIIDAMEPLPRALELEQMSKPYTCFDVVSCGCC